MASRVQPLPSLHADRPVRGNGGAGIAHPPPGWSRRARESCPWAWGVRLGVLQPNAPGSVPTRAGGAWAVTPREVRVTTSSDARRACGAAPSGLPAPNRSERAKIPAGGSSKMGLPASGRPWGLARVRVLPATARSCTVTTEALSTTCCQGTICRRQVVCVHLHVHVTFCDLQIVRS